MHQGIEDHEADRKARSCHEEPFESAILEYSLAHGHNVILVSVGRNG